VFERYGARLDSLSLVITERAYLTIGRPGVKARFRLVDHYDVFFGM